MGGVGGGGIEKLLLCLLSVRLQHTQGVVMVDNAPTLQLPGTRQHIFRQACQHENKYMVLVERGVVTLLVWASQWVFWGER